MELLLCDFLSKNSIRSISADSSFFELLGLEANSSELEITEGFQGLAKQIIVYESDSDFDTALDELTKEYTQYISTQKYKFDATNRPQNLYHFIKKNPKPFTKAQQSIAKNNSKDYFKLLNIDLNDRNQLTLKTQHTVACKKIIQSTATDDEMCSAIADLNYIYGVFFNNKEYQAYKHWLSIQKFMNFFQNDRVITISKQRTKTKLAEDGPLFNAIQNIISTKNMSFTLDDDTKIQTNAIQKYLQDECAFHPYSDIIMPHLANFILHYAVYKNYITNDTTTTENEKYQKGQKYISSLKLVGEHCIDEIQKDIVKHMDKTYPKTLASKIVSVVEPVLLAFLFGLLGALLGATTGLLVGAVPGAIIGAMVGGSAGIISTKPLNKTKMQMSLRKSQKNLKNKPIYTAAQCQYYFNTLQRKEFVPTVFSYFHDELTKAAPPPSRFRIGFSWPLVRV